MEKARLRPYILRCLSWLIDRHCIENSVYQDRITIRQDSVYFTGSWRGQSSNLKGAIIQSCKSKLWKFLFSIFPQHYYRFIVSEMFNSITIKEYDYTPAEVQLVRSYVGRSNTDKMMYHKKYNDGRHWRCMTNREQCRIKRAASWSVIHCLASMS
jgi:hypothetical protein